MRHMDLSSSTKDWTSTPCNRRQSLNHWATREVPGVLKYLWLHQRFSSKEFAYNARDTGDAGSIPESGRSPRGGNGNPLQYYCLESPVDRGAWRAPVHEGPQRAGHDWACMHLGCTEIELVFLLYYHWGMASKTDRMISTEKVLCYTQRSQEKGGITALGATQGSSRLFRR